MLIVDQGAAKVEYLFRDNEAKLSNYFSINQVRSQTIFCLKIVHD